MERMKNATLPEELYYRAVEDMEVGDVGYAVEQAMQPTLDGSLWLSPTFQVFSNPLDAYPLQVVKLENGFAIELLHDTVYTWIRGYVDNPADDGWFPIVSFMVADDATVP